MALKKSRVDNAMINQEFLTLVGLSFFTIPLAATVNMAAAVAIADTPYLRSCRVSGR